VLDRNLGPATISGAAEEFEADPREADAAGKTGHS
jgi:hypothetical protein